MTPRYVIIKSIGYHVLSCDIPVFILKGINSHACHLASKYYWLMEEGIGNKFLSFPNASMI
jgi:hypothetical protein